MATDFKHIRTCIIPFGNNPSTGAYRFSLCIDLNPEYDETTASQSKYSLELFIKEYGSKYFNEIKTSFEVSLNGTKVSKFNFCYESQFIKNVPTIWEEFLKKDREYGASNQREEREKPKYSPSLSLSADSLITVFEKAKPENPIPESTKLRQAAISEYQTVISKKNDKKFESILEEQYESLEASITDMDSKLQGIHMFSDDYNNVQNKLTLNDGLTGKHQSIFDSINSILDVWSYLDSNIVLQRLFGKTIDFEIPKDEFEKLVSENDSFVFSFSPATNLFDKLDCEHLKTQCRYIKTFNIVIVEESKDIKGHPIKLEARNYDVGGKLISLKALKEKFKNLYKQLNDPAKKESEKFILRKELIRIDTAVLTLGINIYNSSQKSLTQIERDAIKEAKLKGVATNKDTVFLSDIRKGYRIAAQTNTLSPPMLTPLTLRKLDLKSKQGTKIEIPKEFIQQQVSISTDTGTHALIEENGILTKKVIVDQAMLNWSGENPGFPSIFSNDENEENFESSRNEGSTDDSTKFVVEYFSNFLYEKYTITGVDYKNKAQKNIQDKLNTDFSSVNLLFEYSFPQADLGKGLGNKKLIFGREYDIILTPEYKNGWAVPFDILSQIKDETFYYLNVSKFIFKRNEPVKPIEFQLQATLSDEKGKPTYLRQGESLNKLVIRNLSNADDNKVYKTQQQSVRHILPPAISFQQAFWHNKLFNKNEELKNDIMSIEESHKWYMKYHFSAIEGKDFMKWNNKGEWVNEPTSKKDEDGNPIFRKYTIEEAIKGSTIMRSFYPNDCSINYLPDPLLIGFRFEFYKDKNRLIKAKNYERYELLEFYFSGKYPKINAWKLILEDYNLNESELLLVNTNKEEIIIRLEKGDELFISARTILSADYEKQFETFGNYNDFTRYGNNDLLTPPLEFSLVHATQRPLVRPKLGNIIRPYKGHKEKERDKTIYQTTITTNIEQTGIYYDESGIVHYIEENIPTGNLEVYAKWEEYKDEPKHLVTDDWNPNEPINHIDKINFKHTDKESPATFETAIEVSKHLDKMEATLNKIASDKNDFKNYAVDLQLSYDIRETKFIEKYFWIKNKSKFTSYYPKDWGTIDEDTTNDEEQKQLKKDFRFSKEIFNRLSSDAFLVRILNSKKPNAPVVSEKNITLISVIEDIKVNKSIQRKASMNRLRFFFERGRLSSGKGERIGFVVNEPQAKYNDYLVKNDLVSIVGRDIVSDTLKPYDGLFRNEDVLLTKANFVINDPYDLKNFETNKKSNDLECFSPKYVKELGLMTYLPKFDKKLNLWYLDIEMDINDDKGRELHSPFLRFSIVHYQENSFNYNFNTENDITKDCRVSEINKSGYVYILPSRNIMLKYDTRPVGGYKKGFIKVELAFDDSSIKNGNPLSNTSKFYMVIRHRLKKDTKWIVADKNAKEDGLAFLKLDSKTAELEFIFYKNNTDYQVVILETEDWGNDNDISFENLIENKNSRIVHVNTFEINNEEL